MELEAGDDFTTAIIRGMFGGHPKEGWDSSVALEAVQAVVAKLPAREALVLTLRCSDRLTLKQCAAMLSNVRTKKLGLSVERVRQIENQAFRRLRVRACASATAEHGLRNGWSQHWNDWYAKV